MSLERKNRPLTTLDVYERLQRAINIYGSEDRLEASSPEGRVSLEIGKRESFGKVRIWHVDANNTHSFVVLRQDGPCWCEEDRLGEHGSLIDVNLRMKGARPLELLSTQRANELANQLYSKIEPVLTKAGFPITS